MSSVILSLTIISKLTRTKQLQKSVAFVQSGTVDYITFLHLFRPGSYTSVYNANKDFRSSLIRLVCSLSIFEALTATTLWSLSYLLRDFLYSAAHNHYNPISNSTKNFQPLSPSNRHPYFTYPVLLFFQTSCATSNVERRHFQAGLVGFLVVQQLKSCQCQWSV